MSKKRAAGRSYAEWDRLVVEMVHRKSDWLIVLRARESRVHGEAASSVVSDRGADF